MSMLWIAVLVVSTTPTGVGDSAATPPAKSAATADSQVLTPRTGEELESAARAALQHWARAGDKELETAGRELLGLFCEVQQDKSLPQATRDELRQKLRSRLLQLAQQITKHRAKESYQAKRGPKSVGVAKADKVLEQQGAAAPRAAGAFGGGGQSNNPADIADAGEDLVQLIQTVVAPKSWEVNGGPGSIYYWRYQRAIVAHTTSEVHEQISDTLEQLNRASH